MARCLIIGSGIVGLSTAYELKKNGFDITIIDDEKTGQATKSAGGILFPLSPWENSKYMQELCLSGHNEYNNFFKKLTDSEKLEINYSKKNLIIFGDKLSLAKKWYVKNKDIKSNYCEKKLYFIEKNIKNTHKNYLLIKDINIIDPNSIVKFYKTRLLNSGVIFKKETVVDLMSYFESDNNKFDYIIVTAGVWSKEILNQDKNINIKPIKGQLLHYKAKRKTIDNVLIYNNYYIIPRSNNNLVVGSTLEDVGFNDEITINAKHYLQKAISEIFSSEVELKESKQTFGFRPYSYLDQPYIEKHPDNKRIIFNFGHFRYGILTAIASAKIVKDIIK